ncbi:MAG: hypothetical protein Sylvanvirus19_16 [Sylvanvirus sp.]|uniref:Uncharacterized protein n=1 Tax=Sylvanvirus sp. TaxID=2487774 RepID=A0A3G5AL37_9VIRU|nr:MAG: hypothetical protein Sylvanvirus19_16 [Sylvanvirus sp.]
MGSSAFFKRFKNVCMKLFEFKQKKPIRRTLSKLDELFEEIYNLPTVDTKHDLICEDLNNNLYTWCIYKILFPLCTCAKITMDYKEVTSGGIPIARIDIFEKNNARYNVFDFSFRVYNGEHRERLSHCNVFITNIFEKEIVHFEPQKNPDPYSSYYESFHTTNESISKLIQNSYPEYVYISRQNEIGPQNITNMNTCGIWCKIFSIAYIHSGLDLDTVKNYLIDMAIKDSLICEKIMNYILTKVVEYQINSGLTINFFKELNDFARISKEIHKDDEKLNVFIFTTTNTFMDKKMTVNEYEDEWLELKKYVREKYPFIKW